MGVMKLMLKAFFAATSQSETLKLVPIERNIDTLTAVSNSMLSIELLRNLRHIDLGGRLTHKWHGCRVADERGHATTGGSQDFIMFRRPKNSACRSRNYSALSSVSEGSSC